MIWMDEAVHLTLFGVPIRQWDRLLSGVVLMVSTPRSRNPLIQGLTLGESTKIPVRWRDESKLSLKRRESWTKR